MASLFEVYRPQTFDDVVGQDEAVRQLRRVIDRGWGGRAYWITGPSGAGKTTLARIIATHGADDYAIEEWDGQSLSVQDVDTLRAATTFKGRCLGKGGRVFIINEAHGMRKPIIRLLLTVLEPSRGLPESVVVIFTTTKTWEAKLFDDDAGGDAAPLLSRCTLVNLVYDDATKAAFAKRARDIAVKEGIDGLPMSVYANAVSASQGNFRRVLGRIESGGFRDDAVAALEKELAMLRSTKGPEAEERRQSIQKAIAAAK